MFVGLTPNQANDNYQFPKRQVGNKKLHSQSNPQIDLSNQQERLSDYDNSKWKDDVILTKINNSSPQENFFEKNTSKSNESRKLNVKKKRRK